MDRSITLSFAALLLASIGSAQTLDLVFFTDDGAKFTLVVDGDVKNSTPEARVIATDIRNETPVVIIRFEDPSIPELRKPALFELGKEHTVMITTNKKGARVLRPTGEAALGTAVPTATKPEKPTEFKDDPPVTATPTPPATSTTQQTIHAGAVDQVTTVTVIEEHEGDSDDSMSINMGVNGMGVNMNINVDDQMGGTSNTTTRTTTTTTYTTTTTSGTVPPAATPTPAPTPVQEPEVYRMPGYSGPIGCSWPMTDGEFADVRTRIEAKSFEETKMTMVKQIGRDRCFTVDQVRGMMDIFSFEDSKLDLAKFAYDRTYDIGNYYKVNDAFTFESSIDDLNKYIQSR